MVKLTRILKNEYRDGAEKSKRERRSSSSRRKKHGREPSSHEAEAPPVHNANDDKREDLTKMPPALVKILQAHTPGYQQADEDREEREQAESMTHNSTDKPHHSALTRAAQMALRSTPGSSDGMDDQESDESTMALIDSIVKTSDDPALIEALHAMMGDASGHSKQQRETLSLMAESLMQKKAAKEALQRAVLAESRLHESLKKCTPERAGDTSTSAAAKGNACVSGDATSIPTPLVSNHTPAPSHVNAPPEFLNRINKRSTNSSQGAKRRLQYVKARTQLVEVSKMTSRSKSRSFKSVPHHEIVVLEQSGTGDVEHPSDEPVFLMSTQPYPSTKEESKHAAVEEQLKDEEEGEEVGETRDDQDVSRRGCSLNNTAAVPEDAGTATPSSRRNKYKYIASIEPVSSNRHGRSSSWKARSFAENQSTHAETVGQSPYVNKMGQSTFATTDGQPGTTVVKNYGSDVSNSAEEDDGSDSDYEEEENSEGDEKVEYTAEGEGKIEYTIFELESKLSVSTEESSIASPFSAESSSSNTEDHEDDDEDVATDSDTLDDGDEDAAVHEGEEEGVSDRGEEEEKEDQESESESEDDNSLLFASFCQRPETSLDNEEVNNEEDDDDTSHDRRGRGSDGRRREVENSEVRSLLKCVSGYFGVAVDEKKKRRRHRSKRREHRRHRD
jgi:hypothetical protein